MNRFVKGMLLGIGIGLLVAPMRGEEMRRKIGERLQQCRGYLPEQEQMDLYKRQITDRVSQTTDSLKGYAQQAASTVKTSAKKYCQQSERDCSERCLKHQADGQGCCWYNQRDRQFGKNGYQCLAFSKQKSMALLVAMLFCSSCHMQFLLRIFGFRADGDMIDEGDIMCQQHTQPKP